MCYGTVCTWARMQAFIRKFVPLDLTPEELSGFLATMTTGDDAKDGRENLCVFLACRADNRDQCA